MAKSKDYALVIESVQRFPGKTTHLPRVIEQVTGAKEAAKRAISLVRAAPLENIDSRTVDVIDAATKRSVMVCQGPALTSFRSKRRARRSFAQCQILQKSFKTAIKAKPKRRR